MKRTKSALAAGCLAMINALAPAPSSAQEAWPARPVTFVVPFPPGGSTDQVARAIAPGLAEKLKQPFVVENKAGATGSIGAGFVKRAAADGTTFLVTSLGPLVITPHLMRSLPYDAINDFDPITVAVRSPNLLVVPTSSPHRSVADLIAYLKANPGKMTFGTAGAGSSDHLTAELFWQQTGTQGVHVPYKGGGPVHADLLGGQVDASFQNINSVVGYVKAGKMRALALTSDHRSSALPDVPTLAELGVKGVVVTSWQAIVAPKGLPPAVRDAANAAIVAAIRDPKVSEQFTSLGYEVVANTPAEFAAFRQQEYDRWKTVVDKGGLSAN